SAIFVGVKLLFDIKARFKRVTIALSIIWWIGVTVLILTGVELGMNFRNHVEVDYDVPITVDSTDVLFVDISEDDIFSNYIEYQQVWNYSELIRVNEDKVYLGYPKLTIVEKRDSGDFEVVLYKESHGKYHKEAIHKAENIQYDIKPFEN